MTKRLLETNEYFITPTGVLLSISETVEKKNISLIIKASNNTILYNITCPELGGTFDVATQTLSLNSTETITEGDELIIILLLSEGSDSLYLKGINEKLYQLLSIESDKLEEQTITNKLLKKIYNPE